jgi:hypothetical protein
VDRLSRDHILEALTALDRELEAEHQPCDLFLVGGAALVLLYGARESTKDVDGFSSTPGTARVLREAAARVLLKALSGTKEEIWAQLEQHVVPGREMKARYAFDDLWEAGHGAV